MGKEKYIKEIEKLFEKSPVVNFNSIDRIIKNKKHIKQYTKQLIRNWLLNGKVKRLTKGYYTKYDNILFSIFCFKPAYFGLQDALSIHELWEQETIPVIITTRSLRPGIRTILDLNVMIRRISKKYFFGFEYSKDGDFYFPVSDIEKTFIDMIYYKQHVDEELIQNFKDKINKKKLKNYLKKYPKRIKTRIMKVLK